MLFKKNRVNCWYKSFTLFTNLFFKRSNKKSKLPDDELVLYYQQSGDQVYSATLFQRYIDLISTIALSYLPEKEAEDAVMDIYEILERDLRKHQIKVFNNWLYSVVRNYCLKLKRQREFISNVEFQEDHDLMMESLDFKYDPLKDQMITSVNNAISQLNADQRKCLQLFYWEGRSYKEIQQITGYDMNKVKSYIQNGKRNLKNEIEAN